MLDSKAFSCDPLIGFLSLNISLKSTSQFHEIFTGLFSSRLFDQYLLFSRLINDHPVIITRYLFDISQYILLPIYS